MRRLQLFRAQTEFLETTSLSLILQGLLALRNYWPTSSWNSCILAQTLIQLIIFSSLLPQTRSCPANFFLKICFCRGCYFSSSPFKVKYLEVPTVQWSSADPKLDKVKLYSLILPRRNLNFSQPLKNSVKSPSLLLTPNLKTWKVVYQPWLFGQMFVSIMTLAAI